MIDGVLIGSGDRFVEVAGHRIAQHEFYGACEAMARRIEESGAERVAVVARPELATVVAVLGALTAGAAVVPVPPDSGVRELAHILSDARPDAWLGVPPAASTPPSTPPLPVVPVDVAERAGPATIRPIRDDRTAFVLYTSGTTGLPKGVVLSRAAVRAGVDALVKAWRWSPDDVLAHGLPLFHVHGLLLGVLGPLVAGGSLLHTGAGTPEAYAAAADRGATMLFGVPTIWSRIAERPDLARRLAPARLLVSGSAPLPVPVWERLRELTGHEVVERYGMTETMITVATRADGVRRAGWVGTPVDGVETRLVDDDGAPVPYDGESVGHLQVRGATLFDGYLGQPGATDASYAEDGWFRTGDVAVIDVEGVHRIVGRESVDLIKSAGWRIGAGEIESTLLGHPAVAEAAVVGVPDDDLGQRIVAHVVLREPGSVSADELVAHVGRELSAHKRPREVRFVTELPRNEMGKVQKTRLLPAP